MIMPASATSQLLLGLAEQLRTIAGQLAAGGELQPEQGRRVAGLAEAARRSVSAIVDALRMPLGAGSGLPEAHYAAGGSISKARKEALLKQSHTGREVLRERRGDATFAAAGGMSAARKKQLLALSRLGAQALREGRKS
jgi:hypothetical protein